MNEARSSWLEARPNNAVVLLYFAGVIGLVARIATLDEWNTPRYCVLGLFLATALGDRVAPNTRNLVLGVAFFGVLNYAVTYLPDLWFSIAFRLNHAQNYLWNANATMRAIPGNDGRFCGATACSGSPT